MYTLWLKLLHDCAKVASPRAGELRTKAKGKHSPQGSLVNIIRQLSPFIQILQLLALPLAIFNPSRPAGCYDIDLPRMCHLKEVYHLLQRAQSNETQHAWKQMLAW